MQGKRKQDRTSIGGVLLAILIVAVQAIALPGDLDTTFGPSGGYLLSDFGGLELNETVADAALQADGKIVVLGSQAQSLSIRDFLVARYNPNGSIDSAFGGGDGFVTITDPASTAQPGGLAIQSDGKIVFAGGAGTEAFVFRLNSDGSLDTSFSGDGFQSINSSGEAFDLAVDSAGKIVLSTYSPSPFNSAGLARLNPDGTLDTTFDGDGRRSLSNNIYAPRGLAIQPDGDIVVAGKSAATANVGDVVLVRVLNDGSLDPTFDDDGILNTNIADRHGEARGVVIQSDGKIVIAGALTALGHGSFDPVVMRFVPSGNLDTTFDGDGIRQVELTGDSTDLRFTDLAIDQDGRIIAVSDNQNSYDFFFRDELKVVRLEQNGALDVDFDHNGVVDSTNCENGRKILIQPNGRVISLGGRDRARNDGDHIDGICVERFTANGSVDVLFNPEIPDGIARIDMLGISAVAELPSGKILIGGWREAGGSGSYEAILMRLNQNGTIDSSFMDEGEYVPLVNLSNTYFFDIDVLTDGSFIAAGEGGTLGGMLVKFTPAGVPDTAFSFDGQTYSSTAARFHAVTVRPDGKVIGCGSSGSSGTRAGRLARFSSTGSFESWNQITFGTVSGSSEILECESLLDGRTIVAGYGSDGSNENAAISRTTDLSVDGTFGSGGTVTAASSALNERASGLAILINGKIVVSTTAIGSDGSRNFGVFRANSDGLPDDDLKGFGEGGLLSIAFQAGVDDEATAILVEPNGSIIVGGNSFTTPSASFAVTKITYDGSFYPGWGTFGRALTSFPATSASMNALHMNADGKLIAAGELSNGSSGIAKYQNVVVPTAAEISISGRVVTPYGQGIRGAVISAVAADGSVRSAVTNSFGYFRLTNLTVGQYVIQAVAKRYSFEDPVRVIDGVNDVTDITFVSVLLEPKRD